VLRVCSLVFVLALIGVSLSVPLVLLCCHFGFAMLSLCGCYAVTMVFLCFHFDVSMLSLWCRYAVTVMSLCCHYRVAMLSLWCRYAAVVLRTTAAMWWSEKQIDVSYIIQIYLLMFEEGCISGRGSNTRMHFQNKLN